MNRIAVIAALAPLLAGSSAAQSNELFELSDEFADSASASRWSVRHVVENLGFDPLEVWEIDAPAHPGVMRMVPHTVSWYEGYKGPLVYQLASGDFALTTRVTISSRSGSGLPGSLYSLAGLMLREPTTNLSEPEDYVFLSLGYGDPVQWPGAGPGPHFEVKTTNDGLSTLEVTNAGVFTAQLQLARIGSTVVALYRRPNEGWTVHRRFPRPDLPAQLQAGIVTYTDWSKVATYTPAFHNSNLLAPPIPGDPSTNPGLPFDPDLDARFDYARYYRVVAPPGFDAATAGDNELIALLGDTANSGQASYCTSSHSTNGCVASLSGVGLPDPASPSGYVINAAGVDGQRTGLMFYGVSGAAAAPWGATGFLCVKAPLQRTPSQNSGGAVGACDGALSVDWNAYVFTHPAALGTGLSAGETVWAQAWWRDPPSAKTTALSDGLAFVVTP